MEIPDAKKLGLCREYPQVYTISFGCRKIFVLWLTGFGDDPGRPDGKLLLREVLKATPQAERAPSSWTAGTRRSLTAHSETYNRNAAHAQSMTGGAKLRGYG